MTDFGHGKRGRIGLRLVLLSLVLAVMGSILLDVVPIMLTSSPVDETSYAIHTLLLPGIALGFLSAVAFVGFAGILLIETERPRDSFGVHRVWDRARAAIRVAVVAESVAVVLGLVLGLVYLPQDAWRVLLLGARFVGIVAIGFYLYWTSERLGPGLARGLGRVALGLGIGSAAVGVGTNPGVLARAFNVTSASVAVDLLWFAGFLTGLLSLLCWIILFSGINVRPSARSAEMSSAGGLTL